ncbi:MAG: DUF5681 domain-containing protein [Stellaceae bacterium]
MPTDKPRNYEIGYCKPPVATQFKKGNRANARGRPRNTESLAKILQRALDAPAGSSDGKRPRLTKRELMIRGLVERSAGSDLAATKLLFELLRKADPNAVAPDPEEAAPLGEDALARLKKRLARLARAQMADPARNPVDNDTDSSSDPDDPGDNGDLTGTTDPNDTPISE